PKPEETLTTWPPPRAIIAGPKAAQACTTPSRLTERIQRQSSTDMSAKRPVMPTPALLTRTSTGPVRAARAATASGSVTSQPSARPVPPASPHSAAVFSAASRSMSAHTTVAPRTAKAAAVARPIPLPAPVTTTRPGGPGVSLRGIPGPSLLTMGQHNIRLLTKGQLDCAHGDGAPSRDAGSRRFRAPARPGRPEGPARGSRPGPGEDDALRRGHRRGGRPGQRRVEGPR